jgi:hypothetical protein
MINSTRLNEVHYIPELDLPEDVDCTEPTDRIVATDGSVLFEVGYHSWLIATKTDQILLWGRGPDDGSPLLLVGTGRHMRRARGDWHTPQIWRNQSPICKNGMQQRGRGETVPPKSDSKHISQHGKLLGPDNEIPHAEW